jgi:winged helix-turn helix protein
VLDGASRAEAAKVGGMDRQTLRDWVIRFNEQGPDGLINVPAPGAPAKLNKGHRAFLARIVDEGPIPAVHGVVRWRACDLIMRLHEEFGTRCRTTRSIEPSRTSASHTSAPGRELTSRIPRRSRHLKKLPRPRGGNPQQPYAGHAGRGVVPDAMRG